MKKDKLNLIAILIVIVTILGGIYLSKSNGENSQINTQEENTSIKGGMSDEEINLELDNLLGILMNIHYISITDTTSSDPSTVILDELQEAMNDKNKLERLQYKLEPLMKSENEVINVTAFATETTRVILIQAYEKWIEYLHGFDITNPDISEFQYQLALFGSSTHDAYLLFVEGASMLPVVAVEFKGEDGSENTINENIKNHFLSKIDELFSDIFIENEKFYKETGNRYAIPLLVQGYKDFFNSPE